VRRYWAEKKSWYNDLSKKGKVELPMKSDKKPEVIKETPLTYDDYASLPDDGNRYELASGALELMSPAPSPRHQAYSNQLQYTLNRSCQSEYLIFSAPVDVILSNTEVRQPDLLMVHRSRSSILTKRGVEGPPDLVVEIMSAYSRKRDKVHKTRSYARHGVPEYWIIDLTTLTLEQYLLNGESYQIHNVYAEDEIVQSERISCVAFSMYELVRSVPDLPD
jgi:Uma2 family endonuclease